MTTCSAGLGTANGSSSPVTVRAPSACGSSASPAQKSRESRKLVRPGIDRILPIGLTREGALYYGVVRATEDVFAADLDPTTGKVAGPPRKAIEHFEGGNFSPSYSPDGKYLAYVSRRGNSPYPTNVGNALCIRSLDTGQERVFYREIWRLGLRYVDGPEWSPDGRFIVFGGSAGIVIEWDSIVSTWRRGEISPRHARRPRSKESGECVYGPDGKYFFGRQDSKAGFSQIVVRDLESGEERELYQVPERLKEESTSRFLRMAGGCHSSISAGAT